MRSGKGGEGGKEERRARLWLINIRVKEGVARRVKEGEEEGKEVKEERIIVGRIMIK